METAKKSTRFSPLVRITAAVLAVIMLSGILIYQRSGVTLNAYGFEDKGNRIAARELLRDDEYANASRVEQMTAFAKNLLSGKHSFEDLELGVQISIAHANYDDAIALSGQMLEIYEGDDTGLGRIYLRLGYLYVMKNDPEKALKWLDEGIAITPTAEAYLTRAQVQLSLNDRDAALRDAAVFLNTADDPDDLLPELVNIYEATGEYETAVSYYSKLIGRAGGDEYLLNRAFCLTNLGRMDEATSDRDRYAESGGKELGSADVMLGIGWMRAKDYAKADDCFIRAIDEQYADPESLYYYVVLCAYVTANYERACSYGDQLIARIRSGEEGRTADVAVESSTGRLNVSLVKTDAASLYLMNGASHLYMGNYSQAADSLTACLDTDPSVTYAFYLRGISRLAAEQYSDAIPDFDAAIAAGEETEKSYYSRAVCRMKTDDRQGALDDFGWVVLHGTEEVLFQEASRQMAILMTESDSQDNT